MPHEGEGEIVNSIWKELCRWAVGMKREAFLDLEGVSGVLSWEIPRAGCIAVLIYVNVFVLPRKPVENVLKVEDGFLFCSTVFLDVPREYVKILNLYV